MPGRTLFANGTDEDDFGLEDLVEEYPWPLRSKELIAMVWDGFGRVDVVLSLAARSSDMALLRV